IGDRDEPPAARIRALVDPGDIEVVVTAPGAPELRSTLHGAAGSVVTLEVPGTPARLPGGRTAPMPDTVTPGLATPGFVMIDRFDARSRAGIELAYVRPSDPLDLGRATVLRFEAHARYVDPGSGFGGYVQVPFAYSHDTDLFGDPITVTDAGN